MSLRFFSSAHKKHSKDSFIPSFISFVRNNNNVFIVPTGSTTKFSTMPNALSIQSILLLPLLLNPSVICRGVQGLTTTSTTTTTTTLKSSSSSAEQNLLNFVDDHGGKRFCKIGATPYGRGLVATKDMLPGEEVLRIPLACVLKTEASSSSSSPQKNNNANNNNNNDDDDDDDESWTGRLAMQLLERQETTKHCPYRESLPVPPSVPSRGDWPHDIIWNEFQNPTFVQDIETAQDWRYQQWERNSGRDYAQRQSFLDCLDLVCSRTIRSGNTLMLVPLLDMANHASREQGGGYYRKVKDDDGGTYSYICLYVGERGVRKGGEVTLDYGLRSNEDWLLHYGFLPDRNTAETVTLPRSGRIISWDDVGNANDDLKSECFKYLCSFETSLEEDMNLLRSNTISDFRHQFAVNYRVSRKVLLSAVSGEKAAAAAGGGSTMYFSSFGLVENE